MPTCFEKFSADFAGWVLTSPRVCAIIMLPEKRFEGEEYLFRVAKRADGRCEFGGRGKGKVAPERRGGKPATVPPLSGVREHGRSPVKSGGTARSAS